MMPSRFRSLRFACVALVSLTFATQPVLAQSVLRDAETEKFFQDITAPMAVSAGLSPNAVKLVLVNDQSINAFVAVGQAIFINAGTVQQADNANELEGVIAHELGHIETGGSALTSEDAMKSATRITLLSLLIGAAAVAAGAGEAGMAAMMAGQSAAEGKFLAFSRAIEGSADAAAVRHLADARYSGKGMVSFFEKLKREEYRLTPSFTKIDEFAVDHPMTEDRLLALRTDLQKSPYWNAPVDKAKHDRFLRIKAKLIGYLEEPRVVLNKYPERDQSVYGHYARAYAWHRGGYPDKAMAEIDALVAINPHDPFFLELKGQILLESGKPKDAVAPLREAVTQSQSTPLIASLLGDALVATEDPANLKEAAQVLKVSVQRDNENPQAWYNLGLIYTRLGDEPRANLASAERWSLEGNPRLAMANAEAALRGIPQGTPDYLRAQDLALVSADQAKKQKRGRN
jgi:predicted Zn-dependent protease